ncbi:MAG: hypothetical protein IH897_13215 [Planctomycetes bacterium]|nr:hypothetical protein [Planctomycetota bacterium]
MSESACDTCRDPGYCCRNIGLSVLFPAEMHRGEVDKHIAEATCPWTGEDDGGEKMPFMHPIRVTTRYAYRGQHKPHGVKWGFSCDRLGKDGRCMQYEDRPEVCRNYEPKTDLLCIEYQGSHKGYLTLYREGDDHG